MENMLRSNWIWVSNWKPEDEKIPCFAYFRRSIQITELPKRYLIHISADSRYKLYINGDFVEAGPCKGNARIWYFDELDIAPYLLSGDNIISIIVLRYPSEHWRGNHGVFRTQTPGLYFKTVEPQREEKSGEWKCRILEGAQIVAENPIFSPLLIYEKVVGQIENAGWMSSGYDDSGWELAKSYETGELPELLKPDALRQRPIPFLKREKRCFTEQIVKTIAPNSKVSFVVDAGELMTGYLKLQVAGGQGAEISILQSECYAYEIKEHKDPFKCMPIKGDRTDSIHGKLYGYTDFYQVTGTGTIERLEIYEPFWFRTFRYIELTIETKEKPLQLCDFSYEEVGYPLEIHSFVETSDEGMRDIWDICERSLHRCMHETYEDCPFYEQLQYAMDTRSQILYTYAISGDARLALRSMEDFRHSQREDGMINCSYPNFETNVIPGFAIYYIGMIYDYMMYFGNKEYIAGHMKTIQGILDFFEKNLDERGIVGKVGDLNRPGNYWSFIDWTPEWDDTNGVPSCTLQGPITMESLLYVLGLQYAAEIVDYLGKVEIAAKYRTKAQSVQCSISRFCLGSNGMYQDGPGIDTYSQHCQVFAILTDTVSKEEGRKLLLETLEHKENYAQCSIAMMFYLFRALEKCDLYEYTDRLWDIWRKMVRNNMTTCGEDSLMCRSDCHAWGALALYELPTVVLGVRPVKPGYEEILVKPQMGRFQWAKGEVITPKGKVQVAWKKETDGTMSIHVHGPENVCIKIDKGDESE